MAYFGDERVMACSRADMVRWLAEFTGAASPQTIGDALCLPADGFTILITLEPAPPRRLGMVVFRENRVQFSYPPEHQTAARALIQRFDFHTQRGGG